MDGSEYWVEISQHGRRLGAGFLLAKRFVLTALHCLNGCTDDTDKVDLSFATGDKVPGFVCERARGADLALIALSESGTCPVSVPFPDRCAAGDSWRAPYRPSIADPYLSGAVQHGSVRYQCEGGEPIEALQLGCEEPVGDYSGYSGGPVERNQEAVGRTVLGVLIEQYPDRQIPGRASGVLFAATIAEALARFDYFDVWHLYGALCPQHDEHRPQPPSGEVRPARRVPFVARAGDHLVDVTPADRWKAAGDRMFAVLKEWAESGLLDQAQIAMLNYQIAEAFIGKVLEAGSDD